mmetsp:Transcript_35129/g.42996  ORF Transcript_35129/g.42996 Transcript_35129/m.42996 type:complete len:346 (-) Transcript_35129:114-1151(-)
MTSNNRFFATTRTAKILPLINFNIRNLQIDALVLQMPHSHLPHEQQLIILVTCPTHMKKPRHNTPLRNLLHEVNLLTTMIMPPPRKIVIIQRNSLHLQPKQRTVLIQQRGQSLLMTLLLQNHLPLIQKRREKVPRPGVVLHVIKPRIGTVWRIPRRVGAVVLKHHVEARIRRRGIVKHLNGIAVPDNVNVLEDEVVTEEINELYAKDFSVHHCGEDGVHVHMGFFFGEFVKQPIIMKRLEAQGLRQIIRLRICSKHQNMTQIEPPPFRRTGKIHQQRALTEITSHHHNGILPGDAFRQRRQFAHYVGERVKVPSHHAPIFSNVLVTGDTVRVTPSLTHYSSPHVS